MNETLNPSVRVKVLKIDDKMSCPSGGRSALRGKGSDSTCDLEGLTLGGCRLCMVVSGAEQVDARLCYRVRRHGVITQSEPRQTPPLTRKCSVRRNHIGDLHQRTLFAELAQKLGITHINALPYPNYKVDATHFCCA